jgi:hypothetical protein
MSRPDQADVFGPSLRGGGYFPALIPAHHAARDIGISIRTRGNLIKLGKTGLFSVGGGVSTPCFLSMIVSIKGNKTIQTLYQLFSEVTGKKVGVDFCR